MCRVEGDGPAAWNICEVADISSLGAGLVVAAVSPDIVDRRITVVAHTAAGASLSIRLTGTVRNVHTLPDGLFRVGVEFEDLVDLEREILTVLSTMEVVW